MKKAICMVLSIVMLFGAVPALAAPSPYVVLSEFNDGELVGFVVKANENFSADFVLVAALCKDDTVLEVKTRTKSQLGSGREISFDVVEGGEIKLFAWNSLTGLQPVKEDYLSTLTYEEVMSQLKLANDYWIKRNSTISFGSNPWEIGVYHTGNMQAYYMTGDELYRNYSTIWSDVNEWNFYGSSISNPDNVCCYQTYIDLYNIDKNENYLTNVNRDVDMLLNTYPLSYLNWIDTFYMAGPIFTKMYELTGNRAYLDKLYNMVKYTAETLNCYDEEVGLWFRDASFIDDISENGEKVYWSRGDGWVYGAFARIIEELPDSYEHKDYFVNIYLEMSEALRKTQCEEGAWHESLLDPDYNPACEESGTGFFTYGLMWGINNGYLSEAKYLDCALRGWKWLTEVALQENGLIGYVQHIGAQPTKIELKSDSTQHYAYANFVFSASEVAKYLGGMQGDVVPYLQKKLLGNIEVYKMDSPYYIKNGEIHEFTHPMIIEEDGDIKILNDYMYILIEDYLKEGMYVYEKDGVYVISEFIAPFNKTELNLIAVLSDILDNGSFPERPYSDPNRISVNKQVSNSEAVSGAAEIESIAKPEETEATKINLTVSDITASHIAQELNPPAHMIDGSLSTRFALEVLDAEAPEYAQFDLGGEKEVNTIGISFYNGDNRLSYFSVSVSTDGETYTEVIPLSKTAGETNDVEYYAIEPTKAKYLRLYGYGNSNMSGYQWFSPTEVEIYKTYDPNAPVEPDEPEEPGLLDSSDFTLDASFVAEPQNGVDKAFDNIIDTYFALRVDDAEDPEYLQIDLGEEAELDKIALTFRFGNQRQYIFAVSTSENGETYTEVVPKTLSSGTTTAAEEYSLVGTKARYVRLYAYGYTNEYVSRNIWFSLSEMDIYKTIE